MHHKFRLPFSNLSFQNWQNLIIFSILIFYLIMLSTAIINGLFQMGFAGDYQAFWSAGKIADEKGYSKIYDLERLKSIQLRELDPNLTPNEIQKSSYSPFPVAYFSIFLIPFQLLSKIDLFPSYWVWSLINSIVLVGYLLFFTKRIIPTNLDKASIIRLLLLLLISFPVWRNFTEGQVGVFLVICVGEFIRQAINKRPLMSGLWLGGLLLKPQLLILIIPLLLFWRSWKSILGFCISSFAILLTSFLLSGVEGMQALFGLWTKFSSGIATNTPEQMVNWRMLGLNLNKLTGGSIGWVVMGLGMVFTIALVGMQIKRKPDFGSAQWVITIAAFFSATLLVTWHSHFHMAIILIPFLIYLSQFKLLSERFVFLWSTAPTMIYLFTLMIAVIFLSFTNQISSSIGYLMAIGGFGLNIWFLIRSLHSLNVNR
jgi:hypothetical protein